MANRQQKVARSGKPQAVVEAVVGAVVPLERYYHTTTVLLPVKTNRQQKLARSGKPQAVVPWKYPAVLPHKRYYRGHQRYYRLQATEKPELPEENPQAVHAAVDHNGTTA